MSDNPRPVLYGSGYEAFLPADPQAERTQRARLVGKHCESGDVLIQELALPEIQTGELLAVPASGAYHLNMGSNYNGACIPAVLWLRLGEAQLIQRRETVDDLIARDYTLAL